MLVFALLATAMDKHLLPRSYPSLFVHDDGFTPVYPEASVALSKLSTERTLPKLLVGATPWVKGLSRRAFPGTFSLAPQTHHAKANSQPMSQGTSVMHLRALELKNFGPFAECRIPFLDDVGVLLLTGKNNEGKSNILTALKLLSAAIRVYNVKKQALEIDGDYVYRLLRQDTEQFHIKRMVHNYKQLRAEVHGYFTGNVKLSVYLDPGEDLIYTTYNGRLPGEANRFFGFIPPLGPLDEHERFIENLPYLRACLNTSLAPRHLRNHLLQLLSKEQTALIRQIVLNSWAEIDLLPPEMNYAEGTIDCYYRERGVRRELSWAGQGLQVWFQIITHLVRLRDTSLLVLDEPEINLHPEKQNELVSLLKQYYSWTIVVATHSVELMNNVSVSHILHVQKSSKQITFKNTANRTHLEKVRSHIGSSFNLIASQFEECEVILFTEDTWDYKTIEALARGFGLRKQAFNVPLHGFSEYRKAVFYREAYELLIGGNVRYVTVLDRDYYPEDYLDKVQKELNAHGIDTVYTLGKELENIFIRPSIISNIVPTPDRKAWEIIWEKLFKDNQYDASGSFQTLHQAHLNPKVDAKTVVKKYAPQFDALWTNNKRRHESIGGKMVLKRLREFCRKNYKQDLSDNFLIDQIVNSNEPEVRKWLLQIYGI
jgi:hypothetical protein